MYVRRSLALVVRSLALVMRSHYNTYTTVVWFLKPNAHLGAGFQIAGV